MPEEKDEKKYIQSVERALNILSFVADKGAVRLNEISEYSRLKPTTAFGLLQTLEHMGYLSRADKGMQYCLGLNSLKIGICYNQYSGLSKKIHHLLVELVRNVDETAYFEIKIGERYYYYDVVLSTQPLKVVPDHDSFISLPPESAVAKVFADIQGKSAYAMDLEEVEPGLHCFAVPFYAGASKVGCVALSGPSYRFTRDKMETAYTVYCNIIQELDFKAF